MSMPASKDSARILQRFDSIHWHDSRLLGVHMEASAPGLPYEVNLSLQIVAQPNAGQTSHVPATLSFLNCRFVKIDNYLLGMSLCGGDIACALALCKPDSPYLREIEASWTDVPVAPEEQLDRLIHFRFEMIVPGGELDFAAEDFDLTVGP